LKYLQMWHNAASGVVVCGFGVDPKTEGRGRFFGNAHRILTPHRPAEPSAGLRSSQDQCRYVQPSAMLYLSSASFTARNCVRWEELNVYVPPGPM
jgi:hypothetical protein